MTKPLLLCAAVLALLCGRADALDEIQPFGGITWNDTLSTVITKLNKTDGVKTVVVAMAPFSASFAGLTTTTAADAAFEALTKKTMTGSNPKFRKEEFAARFPVFVYKGKPVHYWDKPITVTAEAVLIKGVLYRIVATFKPQPGLALVNEKNVVWFSGEPKVAAPLVLDRVEMGVMGGHEHLQDVFDTLNAKYHFAPASTFVSSPNGSIRYNGGAIFYEHPRSYDEKLKNAYQASLSDAAAVGKEDQADKF